jgi:hypothetical protein
MFRKHRLWPYFLLVIVLLWGGTAYYLYNWWSAKGLQGILDLPGVQEEIKRELGDNSDFVLQIVPRLLGFSEPETMLILFQNNTELRPSGGFIGSYATIKMDKGKVSILKVEGSENLDWQTPEDWQVEPPEPLKDYLGVENWFFRDANWSPDFAVSAAQAHYLYTGEGGEAAKDIKTVVGITPTVVEELLKITGPVEVQGIKFSYSDVTEKLEYEVEFGYKERGITVENRKAIIGDIFTILLSELSAKVFSNFGTNTETIQRLIKEKQIMVYSSDSETQEIFMRHGLAGEIKKPNGDFVMWVDSNLGALKTDHAIERNLKINIDKDKKHKVTMTYIHNGTFDWRTSRYRTYVRVFVPKGAVSLEEEIDQGFERGKKWFGKFVSIEPGETKDVTFTYELGDVLTNSVRNGAYNLFVQKQPGTIAQGLTLELDFGKNITVAEPAEVKDEQGDMVYTFETDLREDREFSVSIKQ